jgi:hypothetical protein
MGAVTTDRLRDIPVFASLGADELERLARLGRERRLAAGEFLFRQGDLARAFHVVLDGRLETTREVAGEQVIMLNHGPGGYLGAMALLTETPYRGTTFAVADALVFELDGEELRRLAFSHPSLLGRSCPCSSPSATRSRGSSAIARSCWRSASSPPGSRTSSTTLQPPRRAVATLRAYERERLDAIAGMAGAGEETLAALAALGAEAGDQGTPRERLDPLAESDREQELLDLLEARAVADAHLIAASLTEAGLGAEWVDRTAAGRGRGGPVPRAALRRGLRRRARGAGRARRCDDAHQRSRGRGARLHLSRPGP